MALHRARDVAEDDERARPPDLAPPDPVEELAAGREVAPEHRPRGERSGRGGGARSGGSGAARGAGSSRSTSRSASRSSAAVIRSNSRWRRTSPALYASGATMSPSIVASSLELVADLVVGIAPAVVARAGRLRSSPASRLEPSSCLVLGDLASAAPSALGPAVGRERAGRGAATSGRRPRRRSRGRRAAGRRRPRPPRGPARDRRCRRASAPGRSRPPRRGRSAGRPRRSARPNPTASREQAPPVDLRRPARAQRTMAGIGRSRVARPGSAAGAASAR